MLELRTVTAGYDGKAPVFRDVSLSVEPGQAVGLLGPSGCGKSTLARVAALLHPPDAGTLVVDGAPVRHWRHRAPAPGAPPSASSSSRHVSPRTPGSRWPT